MRRLRPAATSVLLLSVAGCVTPYAVPEPLYRQVDQRVNFSQLRQDAAPYKGTTVMLGGAVLNARILQEGTEIEILQLPLDPSDKPTGPSEQSGGRFLVIDPERRDPVVLQHRLITVVGEVVGTVVRKVDEVDYHYPSVSSRFIHVWRDASDVPASAAYPYYYPLSSPYYYPFGPYYPYYADPFFWSGSFYYYDYHGPSGGPAPHETPRRRFEPPSGRDFLPPSGPPSPGLPSPGPPLPGSGGDGEGGGRRFR